MKELLFYNARIDNQGLAICVSNKDKVVKFTINENQNDINGIVSLFSNDRYIFVGFGNQRLENPWINSLIANYSMIVKENLSFPQIIEEMDRLSREIEHGEVPEEKYMRFFEYIDLSCTEKFKDFNKGILDQAEELKVIQRMYIESKNYISFANYIKNKYRLADINMHPHKFIQAALINFIAVETFSTVSETYRRIKKIKPLPRMIECLVNPPMRESLRKMLEVRSANIRIGNYEIYTSNSVIRYCKRSFKLDEESDDIVVQLDVNRFYPSIVVNNEIYPWSCGDYFIKAFKELYDEISSPACYGNKDGYKLLKTGLNSICGSIGNGQSILFDEVARKAIIDFSKKYILSLVDTILFNDFDVIAINTDAVFIRVNKNKLELLKKCIKIWESKSKLSLKIKEYSFFVMRNECEYIGLSDGDFEYEIKGNLFNDKDVFDYFVNKCKPNQKNKALMKFLNSLNPKQLSLF